MCWKIARGISTSSDTLSRTGLMFDFSVIFILHVRLFTLPLGLMTGAFVRARVNVYEVARDQTTYLIWRERAEIFLRKFQEWEVALLNGSDPYLKAITHATHPRNMSCNSNDIIPLCRDSSSFKHSHTSITLLHQYHRAPVRFPSISNIVDESKQKHTHKHDRRPIECHSVELLRCWPSSPKQNKKAVDGTETIDPDSSATQAPLSGWQGLTKEALIENAADGQTVGRHQREELKRYDGVEGDRRAEIDQGEQDRNDASQEDSILWHCFSFDLRIDQFCAGMQVLGKEGLP